MWSGSCGLLPVLAQRLHAVNELKMTTARTASRRFTSFAAIARLRDRLKGAPLVTFPTTFRRYYCTSIRLPKSLTRMPTLSAGFTLASRGMENNGWHQSSHIPPGPVHRERSIRPSRLASHVWSATLRPQGTRLLSGSFKVVTSFRVVEGQDRRDGGRHSDQDETENDMNPVIEPKSPSGHHVGHVVLPFVE